MFTVDRPLQDGSAAGFVLALDTSSPVAALAVAGGGRVMAEIARPAAAHGAALPDMVGELLERAGLRTGDLRGLAVGTGPGSFTGLRVGISYVKGLAIALKIPVVGVPSLDTMAAAAATAIASPGMLICPILDARKGEIYTALYRVHGDALEKLTEDLITTPEDLVPALDGEVVLVGDVRARDAMALPAIKRAQTLEAPEDCLYTRGRYVAAFGASRLALGASDPVAALEPLYVRPVEAIFKPAAAASS
ncbi:MAG: tRNA (adenosine(37)-N6)-threonylcarbamoyltransferase complex dimerization subunit type 1 TsaB [Candidatus Binataceae bacterium]